MSDSIIISIRVVNETTVAFHRLDVALRWLSGKPPSHYNPPPRFGLRPVAPERNEAETFNQPESP